MKPKPVAIGAERRGHRRGAPRPSAINHQPSARSAAAFLVSTLALEPLEVRHREILSIRGTVEAQSGSVSAVLSLAVCRDGAPVLRIMPATARELFPVSVSDPSGESDRSDPGIFHWPAGWKVNLPPGDYSLVARAAAEFDPDVIPVESVADFTVLPAAPAIDHQPSAINHRRTAPQPSTINHATDGPRPADGR